MQNKTNAMHNAKKLKKNDRWINVEISIGFKMTMTIERNFMPP